MAPVLFLFLISAFAETLEAEWKQAGIEVCTVRSFVGPSLISGKGKLRGHLPKEYLAQDLTAVEILQCLYVDDGAFIFKSCADMTKGLALLHRHFDRLGLEMHIGRGENSSKTECVFFPPPGFFDFCMLSLPVPSNNEIDNAIGCNNNDGQKNFLLTYSALSHFSPTSENRKIQDLLLLPSKKQSTNGLSLAPSPPTTSTSCPNHDNLSPLPPSAHHGLQVPPSPRQQTPLPHQCLSLP